jgi:hypothetical protein
MRVPLMQCPGIGWRISDTGLLVAVRTMLLPVSCSLGAATGDTGVGVGWGGSLHHHHGKLKEKLRVVCRTRLRLLPQRSLQQWLN